MQKKKKKRAPTLLLDFKRGQLQSIHHVPQPAGRGGSNEENWKRKGGFAGYINHEIGTEGKKISSSLHAPYIKSGSGRGIRQ